MSEVELQLITRRSLPVDLVETFNLQTNRDFSMKILTRHPQAWSVDDLDIDFPLKVISVKLFYSTGTRYAVSLARNELLSYTESEYVLILDDFIIVSPVALEHVRPYLAPDLVLNGIRPSLNEPWKGVEQYNRLFEKDLKGDVPRLPPQTYRNVERPNLIAGFNVFPLQALKKVNGWDLMFDGGWGLDDYNLGERLTRVGTKFGYRLPGFRAIHLNHKRHTEEQDDPAVDEDIYIYNRETGARMDFKYARGDQRGQYYEMSKEKKVIRAPVGLEEVAQLLR